MTLVGERPARRGACAAARVEHDGHHRAVRARQAHAADGRAERGAPARRDAPALGRRRGVRRLGRHRAPRDGRARARGVDLRRAPHAIVRAAGRRRGDGGRGRARAVAVAGAAARSSRRCRRRATCWRSPSTRAAWRGPARPRRASCGATAGSWVRMSGELGLAVVGRRAMGGAAARCARSATTVRSSKGSSPERGSSGHAVRRNTMQARASNHASSPRAGARDVALPAHPGRHHGGDARARRPRRGGARAPPRLAAAVAPRLSPGARPASRSSSAARARGDAGPPPAARAIVRFVDIPYFIHWCAARLDARPGGRRDAGRARGGARAGRPGRRCPWAAYMWTYLSGLVVCGYGVLVRRRWFRVVEREVRVAGARRAPRRPARRAPVGPARRDADAASRGALRVVARRQRGARPTSPS